MRAEVLTRGCGFMMGRGGDRLLRRRQAIIASPAEGRLVLPARTAPSSQRGKEPHTAGEGRDRVPRIRGAARQVAPELAKCKKDAPEDEAFLAPCSIRRNFHQRSRAFVGCLVCPRCPRRHLALAEKGMRNFAGKYSFAPSGLLSGAGVIAGSNRAGPRRRQVGGLRRKRPPGIMSAESQARPEAFHALPGFTQS